MHARYVLATSLALVLDLALSTSSHAQYREFEHFHERFRGREPRPMFVPEPRRSIAAVVPHRTGRETDATICDNPDPDPDAAIAACGRIIDRGQVKNGYSLAVAFTHRGQAYENKGDTDHAIADFSDAIRLKPSVAGYFAQRGGVEDKSGNVAAAQADFRKAASLDPKNQDALNGLRRIETRSAVSTAGSTPPPGAVAMASAPATAVTTSTPAKASTLAPPAATAPGAMPVAAASPATPVGTPAARGPVVTETTSTVTTVASSAMGAAAISAQTSTNATQGPRVALVIGNGAYVNANQLPNPPNDAHAVAGALREIGFDVIEGVNLNHAAMEAQFHDFLHKASNASIVLLFYAGHGMQVDGHNYLIPVDAKLAEASDLPFETIEIDKLLDALGDPGHTNIILLDACRDNPLARSFASHLPASRSAAVPGGLAAYSAVGTGTLIAYATAPGQTALDGQGADSPFTTSLLHNIRVPGLEIRQVLTRVRAEVAKETGNRQIPWDNSSLMGDVILVKQDTPGKATAP
jgi:Caspase domain/Tetratricopeptide repeat